MENVDVPFRSIKNRPSQYCIYELYISYNFAPDTSRKSCPFASAKQKQKNLQTTVEKFKNDYCGSPKISFYGQVDYIYYTQYLHTYTQSWRVCKIFFDLRNIVFFFVINSFNHVLFVFK